MHGFASQKELIGKFLLESSQCQSKRDKVSGSNNPGYQHGGKFSKFSKNFINGYDEEWHESHIADIKQNRKDNPEKWKTNIEYWLVLNDGDDIKAKEDYLNFQRRDKNYFVTKYGEDEGEIRWKGKIEKWMNSYTKTNYSKISQELFNGILDAVPELDKDEVYFATFERDNMTAYQNKEYVLKTETSFVRPDFCLFKSKKIIEFDGDYWHSEAVANPEREKKRDLAISKQGYQILHVKEHEYNKDKNKVIQECINFLKQSNVSSKT